MPGIIQRLRLMLDQASVAQMRRDAEQASVAVAQTIGTALARSKTNEAGRRAAQQAIDGITQTFQSKTAELQALVSQGLLSPQAARKQGDLAGREFAAGIQAELQKAKTAGLLTSQQIRGMSGVLAPMGIDLSAFDEAPRAAEKVGILAGAVDRLRESIGLVPTPDFQKTEQEAATAASRIGDTIVDELRQTKTDDAARDIAIRTIQGIQATFDAQAAALQKKVVDGLISPEAGAKQGAKLGSDFARAIQDQLEKLGNAGTLTQEQMDRIFGTIGRQAPEVAERVGLITRAVDFLRDKFTNFPRPDFETILDSAAEIARRTTDLVAESFRDPKVPQAAREAGLAALAAMENAFRGKLQDLQHLVEQGLLTPQGARKQAVLAGEEFLRALQDLLKRGQGLAGVTIPARLDIAGIRAQLKAAFSGSGEIAKATAEVSGFSKATGFLRSQILGLVAPLAALFTLRGLFNFVRDSIKEFEADTAALNNLRVAVQRAGEDFDKLGPRIESVGTAFQRSGRMSAGEFERTLGQLVGMSGDFENSIRNVGLVSDFAAKHSLSLQQATDAVGKAMVGNARGLREYGIEVKKGDDAILALRKDSQGFVDQQGNTLGRQLKNLTFLWGDLKVAVGDTAVEAGEGASAIDTLSAAVQGLTKFVRENKAEISGAFVGFATEGAKAIKDFIDNTRIEFGTLRRIGDTISAFGEELQATLKRVLASIEDAMARMLDFVGDREGAAQVREIAAAYREEAEALDKVAKGHRDSAQAAKDDARAAREALAARNRTPSPNEKTTSHGGPSTVGRDAGIPTGGTATRTVHSTGEGSETDPEIKRIRELAAGLGDTRTEQESARALMEIQGRLRKEIDQGNLSIEERGKRLEKLTQIERALQEVTDRNVGEDSPRRGNATPGMFGKPNLGDPNISPVPVPGILQGQRPEGLPSATTPTKTPGEELFGKGLTEGVDDLTGEISDRWDELFSHIADGSETLGGIVGGIFKGMAQGLASEISKIAKLESRRALANALRETAEGIAALFFNPGAAAAHFKSAAIFTAEAAAWGALGGVAGSVAGSGGGGGGAGGGAPDRSAERDDPARDRQPATIIIQGGLLDTDNSYQMDALAKAITVVDGRDVVVKRG